MMSIANQTVVLYNVGMHDKFIVSCTRSNYMRLIEEEGYIPSGIYFSVRQDSRGILAFNMNVIEFNYARELIMRFFPAVLGDFDSKYQTATKCRKEGEKMVMSSVEEDIQREITSSGAIDKLEELEEKCKRLASAGVTGLTPYDLMTKSAQQQVANAQRAKKEAETELVTDEYGIMSEVPVNNEVVYSDKPVEDLLAEFKKYADQVISLNSTIDGYGTSWEPDEGAPSWMFKDVVKYGKKKVEVEKALSKHMQYDTSWHMVNPAIPKMFPDDRVYDKNDRDVVIASVTGDFSLLKKYHSVWDYMQEMDKYALEQIGTEKKVSIRGNVSVGLLTGAIFIPLLLAFPATMLPIAAIVIVSAAIIFTVCVSIK